MTRFQNMLKDRMFVRYGVFILFTATFLYIIYFTIKNIGLVTGTLMEFLANLSAALSPLIIGLIIAYIINPLISFMEIKVGRRILRLPDDPDKTTKAVRRIRTFSVIMTYVLLVLTIVVFIYGLAALLLGRFVFDSSLPEVYDEISIYIVTYEKAIRDWVTNLPEGVLTEQLDNLVQNVIKWITDNFSAENAMNLIGGVGVGVVNFVIGIMVSIYLSIDKDFFLRLWNQAMELLLAPKHNTGLRNTMIEVNGVTSKFMRGVLLDALIVGTLSSIALMVSGLEFAVFVGIFAGICNIIPYFGPIIGMVPAFIIGFFTDGLWQGLIAIVILFVIQQIDASLIYPRVVGSSTGLHPLFVLLAVSIGGYYWGLVGMILAVPIAGILQIFIRRWAVWKESARQLETKS